jgi:hypothetical protein
MLRAEGVEPLRLPARSPNLNAFAEKCVRSLKEECLSKLILVGEGSLRRALNEYVAHSHSERNQCKGKCPAVPRADRAWRLRRRRVECRERLGGRLHARAHELLTLWGEGAATYANWKTSFRAPWRWRWEWLHRKLLPSQPGTALGWLTCPIARVLNKSSTTSRRTCRLSALPAMTRSSRHAERHPRCYDLSRDQRVLEGR